MSRRETILSATTSGVCSSKLTWRLRRELLDEEGDRGDSEQDGAAAASSAVPAVAQRPAAISAWSSSCSFLDRPTMYDRTSALVGILAVFARGDDSNSSAFSRCCTRYDLDLSAFRGGQFHTMIIVRNDVMYNHNPFDLNLASSRRTEFLRYSRKAGPGRGGAWR